MADYNERSLRLAAELREKALRNIARLDGKSKRAAGRNQKPQDSERRTGR